MSRPLAIDLFCGAFGWSEGLVSEGWRVVGFDVERLPHHGPVPEHCELVLQNILTLHGKQFKDAALIVASPPCQEFSYMSMPWTRAKKIRQEYLDGTRDVKKLTALFDACFRIQREAIEAAGHFIPLVVENVRGANEWVGRSKANFGSYHLWGDVPALMPITAKRRMKQSGTGSRLWSERIYEGDGHAFHQEAYAQKNTGGSWFNIGSPGQKVVNRNPVHEMASGVKGFTPDGQPLGQNVLGRKHGSKSSARKAASAMIARIPLPLARWIAAAWKPL